MKSNYLIPIIVFIGLIVLFFFPEPETNFLAYVGTTLFFIALIVFLIVWQKRKNKTSKQ
jgi:L-asparagine transporter-like permease